MKETEKQKALKGQKITKEFQFKLTDEEGHKLGKAAGALEKDIAGLEAKKKEAAADWNTKIKTRADKLHSILEALGCGEEKRTVDVMMFKDFEGGEVRFEFNGVVLERRPMTSQERQMNIDDVERRTAKPVDIEERGTRARGVKQKLLGGKDPVAAAHEAEAGLGRADMEDVIRQETKRGTKSSSVDGPTRN